MDNEMRQMMEGIKARKNRLAGERDGLRTALEEFDQLAEDLDMGIEDIESGIRSIENGLDQISGTI